VDLYPNRVKTSQILLTKPQICQQFFFIKYETHADLQILWNDILCRGHGA